jgi:hypothetical protein
MTACRMIGACARPTTGAAVDRATEEYCDRQSLSGFPGVCRMPSRSRRGRRLGPSRARACTVGLGAYNATPPQADGLRDRRYPAKGAIRGRPAGAPRNVPVASHPSGACSSRLAEATSGPRQCADAAVAEETWDGPRAGCCRRRSGSPSPPVMSGARTAVDSWARSSRLPHRPSSQAAGSPS